MDTSKKKRVYLMKYPIPAVIFAGGKSSRMGRDKALLPFAGHPSLASYQYTKLQSYFDKVYLSAKSDKFDFEANVIQDLYTISSPLAGILSIFAALKADEIFILSVDAPFINGSIIQKIIEEKHKGKDAIIAQTINGIQPLCGLYRRSLLPFAQKALEADRHKLTTLLKNVDTHFVPFEEEELFANLNQPHEYMAALELLKGS
jgi:molybdopterin-guanine dinucleotide biosynthesis protein A